VDEEGLEDEAVDEAHRQVVVDRQADGKNLTLTLS
jgi:hypothetical protein